MCMLLIEIKLADHVKAPWWFEIKKSNIFYLGATSSWRAILQIQWTGLTWITQATQCDVLLTDRSFCQVENNSAIWTPGQHPSHIFTFSPGCKFCARGRVWRFSTKMWNIWLILILIFTTLIFFTLFILNLFFQNRKFFSPDFFAFSSSLLLSSFILIGTCFHARVVEEMEGFVAEGLAAAAAADADDLLHLEAIQRPLSSPWWRLLPQVGCGHRTGGRDCKILRRKLSLTHPPRPAAQLRQQPLRSTDSLRDCCELCICDEWIGAEYAVFHSSAPQPSLPFPHGLPPSRCRHGSLLPPPLSWHHLLLLSHILEWHQRGEFRFLSLNLLLFFVPKPIPELAGLFLLAH